MEMQQQQPGEEFMNEKSQMGWPWKLSAFSVFVFAFSIFIFLGLKFGYQSYLDERIDNLDREFGSLTDTITIEEQERFVSFYSQLVNLGDALDSHTFTSNVFSFLERHTMRSVYFTSARQDVALNSLNLDGLAEDFDALSQQMAVFENQSETFRVVLASLDIRDEGAAFSMEITWSRDFLRKPVTY